VVKEVTREVEVPVTQVVDRVVDKQVQVEQIQYRDVPVIQKQQKVQLLNCCLGYF
jgi:hypothetical protein